MVTAELLSPVEHIPSDPVVDQLRDAIALCLSGGGYRAMLFHLGTLWRLNEAGYLPKIERISSVSGGSITAGVLGAAWSALTFDDADVAQNFEQQVAQPIRALASKTVDVPAGLRGVFGRGMINDAVAAAYRKHLFGDKTLQDLPSDAEGPRFVINAANLQSGALWRFSKPYMWDWRVGKIERSKESLAGAVAASSAFPPFLSPAVLRFKETDFVPGTGADLQRPPYTTKVILTDGGVYDNLGIETAWKQFRTVLVCDAGGKMGPEPHPKSDWPRHTLRVLNVIDNQVRSLRRRQVIAAYQADPTSAEHRLGAYWSTRTDFADYAGTPGLLPCDLEHTCQLAEVPTRLARVPGRLQERLINWGYAACDAALRRDVDRTVSQPQGFPFQKAGV